MENRAPVLRTRLLLTGFIAAPVAAVFLWHISPALALGVLGASHAPLLYGTLRANAQLFGPVATRFVPAGNEVWLTIDDGPCPRDTPRLLDLLDAAGARATFFVRGDHALANPNLILEILRRGHQLGNHTFSHPQATFWCLPPWRVRPEIDRCTAVLVEITGAPPLLFRAPVGMANPFVHQAVLARGLRLVGWSARGYDGVIAQPAEVVERICRDLRPGAIILLHEGRTARDGTPVNVRALALLLAELTARGYRCTLPSTEQLL